MTKENIDISINKKIIKIEDGRIFEILDKNEQKLLLDDENYIIENENYILIDLDKNIIKPYVRYLIKGMEGSRELGAIIFNRYIYFIMFIFQIILLVMVNNINTVTTNKETPKTSIIKSMVPNTTKKIEINTGSNLFNKKE